MTGPKSFSGPIDIQLSKGEKLPIVDFESVDCEVPDIILSKDQQYYLHISSAIKSGNFPMDLSAPEPGSLSLSRWFTTANRVLRLYVSWKPLQMSIKY